MTTRIRSLVAAGLVTAALALPAAASAHNIGYCGYGASGWSYAGGAAWVEDRWAGQQSGGWLLILHDYTGIAAPSDYSSWCRLY